MAMDGVGRGLDVDVATAIASDFLAFETMGVIGDDFQSAIPAEAEVVLAIDGHPIADDCGFFAAFDVDLDVFAARLIVNGDSVIVILDVAIIHDELDAFI